MWITTTWPVKVPKTVVLHPAAENQHRQDPVCPDMAKAPPHLQFVLHPGYARTVCTRTGPTADGLLMQIFTLPR
jgi:hypothetical protein